MTKPKISARKNFGENARRNFFRRIFFLPKFFPPKIPIVRRNFFRRSFSAEIFSAEIFGELCFTAVQLLCSAAVGIFDGKEWLQTTTDNYVYIVLLGKTKNTHM